MGTGAWVRNSKGGDVRTGEKVKKGGGVRPRKRDSRGRDWTMNVNGLAGG